MTATMNMNGKGRKSLSDQLDRLDSILDVLGDGLNEAVAEAVKSAVGTAIQQVLAELLTNPEVLTKLRSTVGPAVMPVQPSETKTGVWQRLGGMTRASWNWMSAKASQACNRIGQVSQICGSWVATEAANGWAWVRSLAAGSWAILVLLWALVCRFRTPLLLASSVGLVVGLGFYCAGREVASVGCGLAGFAGSLVSGAADRFRRMLPFLAARES